jgi:hypothetical protein
LPRRVQISFQDFRQKRFGFCPKGTVLKTPSSLGVFLYLKMMYNVEVCPVVKIREENGFCFNWAV